MLGRATNLNAKCSQLSKIGKSIVLDHIFTKVFTPIAFPFATHIVCMEVGRNENFRVVFCKIVTKSLGEAHIMNTKRSKLSRNRKSFQLGQSITKLGRPVSFPLTTYIVCIETRQK